MALQIMIDFLLKDWRRARQAVPGLWGLLLLTALVVFAGFACVASAFIVLFQVRSGIWEMEALLRPLVKSLFFGAVTALAMWGLIRRRTAVAHQTPAVHTGRTAWAGLVVVVVLVMMMVFPNLSDYPWLAPDEAHHLVVARNLAEHNVYASGRPETGFRPFDSYDSVGPPVIVPVAAALHLAGTSLKTGRVVMAAYYLVFCLLLFLMMSRTFGGGAATMAVVLATAGFGSVYLGRTLYGEVPALAFVSAGLLAWRTALAKPRMNAWCVITGISFGLAVLCKTVVALSVFPLLGMWVYDAMTFRRIRLAHVIVAGAGGAAVIGTWWMIQALGQHDVADAASDTLNVYGQYLMFGLKSVPYSLSVLAREPFTLIGLSLAMWWIVPHIFVRRYDPALVGLFLIGIFYVYWWVFFTPGTLLRYLWFSYAIAGAFAGVMVWSMLRRPLKQGVLSRLALLGLCLSIAVPPGLRVIDEAKRVYLSDEMASDIAVADYVRALPEDSRVHTTWWPLAGNINFLGDRPVDVIEGVPDSLEASEIVIVDAERQPELHNTERPHKQVGRYIIYSGTK